MFETHIEIEGEMARRLADKPNLLESTDVLCEYLDARHWVVTNNLGSYNMQSWDVADRNGTYIGVVRIINTDAVPPPTNEASVRRLSAEQYDTLSEASDRLDELGFGILGEAITKIADEFGPYS